MRESRFRAAGGWIYNSRMKGSLPHLLWLALFWILYGVLHSVTAAAAVKHRVARRFPALIPAYRLLYNLLALVLLIPPLWLLYTRPGEPLWRFSGPAGRVADGLALLALIGFLHSLRQYDTGEFSGLKQWQAGAPALDDRAPMTLSWLHRFVRHPLYFFGLLILWTREPDAAMLTSAVAITAYLAVGSRLEENGLVALYGERYLRYREKVPGLVPRPWRYLSRADAHALMQDPPDTAYRLSDADRSEPR